MLTENGMGVEGEDKFRVNGMIQDDYRGRLLSKGHLRELHRAIEDGANCVLPFDLDLYWLLVMAQ